MCVCAHLQIAQSDFEIPQIDELGCKCQQDHALPSSSIFSTWTNMFGSACSCFLSFKSCVKYSEFFRSSRLLFEFSATAICSHLQFLTINDASSKLTVSIPTRKVHCACASESISWVGEDCLVNKKNYSLSCSYAFIDIITPALQNATENTFKDVYFWHTRTCTISLF